MITVDSIRGKRTHLFIDNAHVAPRSGRYLQSYDPSIGEPSYEAADAAAADVDLALAAANNALRNPDWRDIPQGRRGAMLRRLAELILLNAEELAQLETRDNGTLLKEMRGLSAGLPETYIYYAGIADKIHGEIIPMNRNEFEPLYAGADWCRWHHPTLEFAPASAFQHSRTVSCHRKHGRRQAVGAHLGRFANVARALEVGDHIRHEIRVVGDVGHDPRAFDHHAAGIRVIGIGVVARPMTAWTPHHLLAVPAEGVTQAKILVELQDSKDT